MFLVQQHFDGVTGLCRHHHADAYRMGASRRRRHRDRRCRYDPAQHVSNLPAGVGSRVPCVLARRPGRADIRPWSDPAGAAVRMVRCPAIEARGMNKALIRGLCLFALVASLALRVQANQVRVSMLSDFDIGAAVTAVISEHGYALRENPVKPPKLLAAAVYFQRPECSQASFVLPYLISAETLPMLTRLNKPEFA